MKQSADDHADIGAPAAASSTRRAEMRELVRDAEVFFDAVAEIGIGLWSYDIASETYAMSGTTASILGVELTGVFDFPTLRRCIHVDDLASMKLPEPDGSGLPDGTFRIVRRDTGSVAWVTSAVRTIRDAGGTAVRILGTLRDITQSRQNDVHRKESEDRLDAALTAGRMVVWDLNVATGIVTRSANAVDVLGVRQEPILDFYGRVHPDDRARVNWETSTNPIPPTGDVRFRYAHPSGKQVWLETGATKITSEGSPGHVIGLTTDVTDRQLVEQQLVYTASHDSLTGILSRKAWTVLIEELVSQQARHPRPFRLMLLDLDEFKSINDTIGHDGGDAVLSAVGERLRGAHPPLIAAARLGGDEFGVILETGGNDLQAASLIDDLIDLLSAPVAFGERKVPITFSVGLARCPEDAATVNDLVKSADLALYRAKQSGRNRTIDYTPQMRAVLDERTLVVAQFRTSLEAGHIRPFYQPKVELATGRIVGFEALARWSHPSRGVLTPAAFSSVFEDGDLTRRFGAIIRTNVLSDMRTWLDRGLPFGRVAINCASHDFIDEDFAKKVLSDLRVAGVPTDVFEIEVTEGVMMDRYAAPVGRALAAFRDAGVKISLDDFGTGYASLIHLKRFPIHEIKIDRSFVGELDDAPDTAIIAGILAMSRSLGLTTVAEGVETVTQAERLLALGCSQAQGFLFGKPMHPDRIPHFIGQRTRQAARTESRLRRSS